MDQRWIGRIVRLPAPGADRTLGFTMRPSAAAAAPGAPGGPVEGVVGRAHRQVASAAAAVGPVGGSVPAATVPAGVFGTGNPFPLVAFLITSGTEDSLHAGCLASYIELDGATGRTILFQDIGNPNVRGPVVRRLIKEGVLPFDPSDVSQYERAVAEAGGETAYRRQEIDKLRSLLGIREEPTPFILVVSSVRRSWYAILRIPEAALAVERSRSLWQTVLSALSDETLRRVRTSLLWEEESMSRLQAHLDQVADRLEGAGDTSERALFVISGSRTELSFAGTKARLRTTVGLTDLRDVLRAPRDSDGRIVVEMGPLWRANHVGVSQYARLPATHEVLGAVSETPWGRRFQDDLVVGEDEAARAADSRTVSEVRRERQRLLRRRDAVAEADPAQAERLDEKIAELEKYLGHVTGLGRRPRFSGGSEDAGAEAVRKGVRRAIDRISTELPAAGMHLRTSVRIQGGQIEYSPESPVIWTT